VFVDKQSGDRHLWGLVSAVVDTERLYAGQRIDGIQNLPLKDRHSRPGRNRRAAERVFFGDPGMFSLMIL
jgi:sensor domain CHASE-containing protein